MSRAEESTAPIVARIASQASARDARAVLGVRMVPVRLPWQTSGPAAGRTGR